LNRNLDAKLEYQRQRLVLLNGRLKTFPWPNLCRIAESQMAIWNIIGNDGSRSHDGLISDGDAFQDDSARTNERPAPDAHRFAPEAGLVPQPTFPQADENPYPKPLLRNP
jgi:hypothetical protein